MGWRQIGRMVDCGGVHAVSTRRLDRYEDIAKEQAWKRQASARVNVTLPWRRAPSLGHLGTSSLGERFTPPTGGLPRDVNRHRVELRHGDDLAVVRAALNQLVEQLVPAP